MKMHYHVKLTSGSLPNRPNIGVTDTMDEFIELGDDIDVDTLLRALANYYDDNECEIIDIDSIVTVVMRLLPKY